MGSRGPKKGFKLAKKQGAATPLSSIATPETPPVVAAAAASTDAPPAPPPAPAAPRRKPVVLSAEDRENPHKLKGAALRELAHKNGMAKSEIDGMPEEKLREQMQRFTVRRYEDLEVA
jgi:hypothetical protein